MKTSELIGPALDRAVAKALNLPDCLVFGRGSVKDMGFSMPSRQGGYIPMLLRHIHDKWVKKCDDYPWGQRQVIWSPSTDWAQGGPIIEREKIFIVAPYRAVTSWKAYKMELDQPELPCWLEDGPAPLIAAMRCYVASKMGDEVEIPAELA